MTTSTLISRIQALAGPDVAAAIAAEFGGTTVYVRPPAKEHRLPPQFRISATFGEEAPLTQSVTAVAAALVAMSYSVTNLVLEVESGAPGDGALERLSDVFANTDIKVIAMQKGAQA